MRYLLKFLLTISLIIFINEANAQSTPYDFKAKAKQQLKTNYKFLDGTVDLFTTAHCKEAIQYFGNCFGANPAAPYILTAFQTPGNEYIDSNYPPSLTISRNGKTYRGVTRTHPTEAKVVLIDLPPRSAYLGFQTYLFSKYGSPSNTLLDMFLPSTQHPNPRRFSVFNSISNSVNFVNIKNQIGLQEPWEQGVIAIVTTPDKKTFTDVKSALQKVGLPSNRIFSETLGYSNKMGLGETKNDYVGILRYVLPEDSNGRNYQLNPRVTAFRVIAKGRSNSTPYSNQILDSRTSSSESNRDEGLKEVNQILKDNLFKSSSEISFISPINIGIDTYKCDQNNRNCLGETRDTDTYLASSTFKLKKGELALLTGVNHNRSGNSTYFSISINDMNEVRPGQLIDRFGKSISGISQVAKTANFTPENYQLTLDNSAARVFKDLNISTPQSLKNKMGRYWTVLISRSVTDCGNIRDCYVLPNNESGILLNKDIRILRRVYIKPGTSRGPAASGLLDPILNLGS